jgi:hypothetical protein
MLPKKGKNNCRQGEFVIDVSQAALARQNIHLIVQKMAATGEFLVFCPPSILA